jgi:hypothetical protein
LATGTKDGRRYIIVIIIIIVRRIHCLNDSQRSHVPQWNPSVAALWSLHPQLIHFRRRCHCWCFGSKGTLLSIDVWVFMPRYIEFSSFGQSPSAASVFGPTFYRKLWCPVRVPNLPLGYPLLTILEETN